MKTVKVFMLVIFFSILIFISLFAFATNSSEKQASDFQSNGDLIEGWYWLRDSALHNYAEWTFDNIPLGPEEITVKINALATDRPSGGRGFDAKFLLYYSFRGEGDIPLTYIPPQTVTLDNVSSPDDPLGYSCQGQVTIPASMLPAASRISLRIRRGSAQDNHVAFKEDSIVLLTDAIYPPSGDPSPNDDDFEGAVPIQQGTYTGSLGEEDEEGYRDNRDYYSIDLEDGQQITLQLTIPGNAQYGISLFNPNRNSRGASITQKDIKTLDYVANSTGTWYIKIHRSSGEGEYQLAIDIQDQNDVESGQDAGDSYQGAIPISPDTFTGLLKAGDNVDYYSIDLEDGQQITLQLTIPGNAQYGISLFNPNRNSRGASITQKDIKTLDYVANSTGTWYIKIHRSSGEGEYQLAIDIQDQNDVESGQDAGDSYQGAIPISPDTFTGLLKAEDNVDYYSIDLEDGQQITLQLTIPGNAQYGISLFNPNRNSRGASITQKDIKTLDYVANSTGTWYIKIHRSSGEGEYQLVVNTSFGGAGVPDNYSPVISSLAADQDSIEINHYVEITCNASDQDGDTLRFGWTANGVDVGGNNSSLNWRAPATAGTYTITCTVNDSKGGQDRESVSITVTELPNGDIVEVNYRIEITTGTRIAAGTDANVFITLFDKDGHDSGEILLDNPGVNDFERGDTNTFLVTAINIEGLDYIIIRHDNSGNFPGWYVDEVYVYNEEINKEWTFSPDQWLATDEPPDYQTQGRFYPEEEGTSGGNIEYILSLTNGGKTLTSNLPIFIAEDEVDNLEIDSDRDGIVQEWEDMAMEYIKPYIELDKDEPWLTVKDTHRVAHYVRVHPYPDFYDVTDFNYHSTNLPQFIIFRYVVTWSMDYGRKTVGGYMLDSFTSHEGDHERIFMAWKVIDSNTLRLEWVFTSSHEDPDAHHAVWNSLHRTCNKGDVAGLLIDHSLSEYDHSEVFCGNLQFSSDGRLIIFASEGKHALYPSCAVCEGVMLVDLPGPVNVGEDCGGGGRFRFYCYNVGEPHDFIDPHVADLTLDEGKLKGALPNIFENKLNCRYRIQIKTGNEEFAGTDAKISIKLFGSKGTSQWFEVYTKPEPPRSGSADRIGTFEKGDTDNIYINSLDLGEINQIQIKHDDSGSGPGWYISEIWVEDLETNTTWHCQANTWLEKVFSPSLFSASVWKDNTNKTFNLE